MFVKQKKWSDLTFILRNILLYCYFFLFTIVFYRRPLQPRTGLRKGRRNEMPRVHLPSTFGGKDAASVKHGKHSLPDQLKFHLNLQNLGQIA